MNTEAEEQTIEQPEQVQTPAPEPQPAPETTPETTEQPQEQEQEQQESQQPQEPTAKELADKLNKQYSLNPDEQKEEAKEQQDGEKKDEETPYSLELPEDSKVTGERLDAYTAKGKELGLNGKALGQFVDYAVQQLEEEGYLALIQQDAVVRNRWGSAYDANMRDSAAGLEALRVRAGLSVEEMAPLASPLGRLLGYELLSAAGLLDSPAAGLATPQDGLGLGWANAAMRDPGHPDYAALHNMNHPRHDEVMRRYDQVKNYPR